MNNCRYIHLPRSLFACNIVLAERKSGQTRSWQTRPNVNTDQAHGQFSSTFFCLSCVFLFDTLGRSGSTLRRVSCSLCHALSEPRRFSSHSLVCTTYFTSLQLFHCSAKNLWSRGEYIIVEESFRKKRGFDWTHKR